MFTMFQHSLQSKLKENNENPNRTKVVTLQGNVKEL